jgi:hypothetical protein
MLTAHGPLTLEQFAALTDLSGVDYGMLDQFLCQHSEQYSRADDGSYWFAGQMRPCKANFPSMGSALLWAFGEFPVDASVEEVHRLLCLSTIGGIKPITRRSISRELSRRTDLFTHSGRARYMMAGRVMALQPAPEPVSKDMFPVQIVQAALCNSRDDEEDFNPFTFFGSAFEFPHT